MLLIIQLLKKYYTILYTRQLDKYILDNYIKL